MSCKEIGEAAKWTTAKHQSLSPLGRSNLSSALRPDDRIPLATPSGDICGHAANFAQQIGGASQGADHRLTRAGCPSRNNCSTPSCTSASLSRSERMSSTPSHRTTVIERPYLSLHVDSSLPLTMSGVVVL